MKLSLYLCTSFFILIQYYGKSFQFNTEDTCPTSRRLLLFGGFQFPLGEKKSEPVSSPETKHSRTHRKDEHAVTIYIQPQTSSELGRKVRSFSHLLKPKLQTAKKEKPKATKTKKTKKKPREISKEKEKKQKKTVETPKTRDLVSVNDQELDRCRALLHLEPSNGLVPVKEKPPKSKKKEKKVKPVKETPTPSVNKTKKATKSETNEKKKKKSSEKSSVPLTPPKTKVDKKETPSSPPSSPPPPPSTKRESVSVPPAESNPNDLDQDQDHDDHEDNDEKNGTVVGRAYHFMKSMFQLSDDNLESNQTESMIPSMDQTGSKRKLLSFDHLSHISSRHLLSVKNSKKSSAAAAAKPKVGWAYRYRISRYLADQKSRQKRTGGTKQKGKSSSTKGAKRKLLETDEEFWTSDEETVVPMSVSITETFVPKRQLLAATSDDDDEDNDNDDNGNDDQVKVSKRRRMKSYEELTDPVAIVRYYDQGLFKPRVGWQFRYRVSRYIDSLRENIREDQERLKLGLEAIKRKTPQELSGRRKRVLDKPFKPEAETSAVVQENKPSVGWRYRYRISKMMEAKARGEYVDDSETKRKGKTDQKKTGRDEDDECIEWEFEPDPELRKIGSEGRKVGWDYRYRIRRKLDHLKQKQAETGVPFDWETLSVAGKREKKAPTPAAPSAAKEEEKPAETNKKSVGWQYRYRVSKMLEAQKKEATDQTKKKKTAEVPLDARLDPELAKLTPEQRVVGWAYRYRIRRKLDAIKNATKESDAGKRRRKDRDGRKKKEKIIKKVEESIEKILNIEDIDETPFMEYFRRASSYVLFGLVPTARKSVCLLPLPVTLSFCNDDDEPSAETTTTTPPVPITPVKTSSKKEKVKKDRRSSSSRPSKTEPVITSSPSTTTARTSTTTPPPTTTPTTTSKKAKKKSSNSIRRPSSAGGSRRYIDEQVKHYDEEEEPIRRRIGVPSMKHKTKKKFQILGQEVKVKTKATTPVTTTTTTTPVPPVQTTTTPAPTAQTTTTTTTTTTPRPVVLTTTSTPTTTTIMTTTTAPPPPPPPTSPPPTIPEQEASTILSSADASTDEANEEMKETVVERPVTPVTNSEEETDTETDDDESGSEDTEDDDSKEDTEESNENFDPLALKKMKKLYQTAKESMHGVFDFDDEKDSP